MFDFLINYIVQVTIISNQQDRNEGMKQVVRQSRGKVMGPVTLRPILTDGLPFST